MEFLSEQELDKRIVEAKKALGKKLVILGHHYQKDSVIKYADYRGDSLKLSQLAAEQDEAEYIVFCGVHFMAETADILSADFQKVSLPDLKAGCSMADMADLSEVLIAYEEIQSQYTQDIIPVTYVNSTAEIKAFCGSHNGMTVTSSNAEKILAKALSENKILLFLPDQHLGRNTAKKLGVKEEEMFLWDPNKYDIVLPENPPRLILWKGSCCVHQTFLPKHIAKVREEDPDIKVIVHPECDQKIVDMSDYSGSTDFIIRKITEAPDGSKWAVGTEFNLVNRLANENPTKKVISLNEKASFCRTMNRIDPMQLLMVLESLKEGKVLNQIKVEPEIAKDAKIALTRMLEA